ncbi:hypothetical protein [Shewanella sp. TC10]|uniref:hypothetical protein n=1 Tax=Shewanella sp. TC10 TaxID=1419739 RepID=UPI00129DD471|nr:hypothetical protein [Shewanella sp. TC10]
MESALIIVLQILILISVGCIFLFRKLLFSYSSEKGKNLATKEDIAEITNKIESVKNDYAHQLEATKADLSSQLQTSSIRYEREFSILEQLTELLVDVRNRANSLRPVFDRVPESKTEEEIKNSRLQSLYEARLKLYELREKKRPFYPESIYDSLTDIDKLAHTESVKYQYQSPFDSRGFEQYWQEAEKNQKEIAEKADISIKLIRARVIEWEQLSAGL